MSVNPFGLYGPHVNAIHGGMFEAFVSWQPPVVLSTQHEGIVRWARERMPRTIFIGRHVREYQIDFNQPIDPILTARQYCDMTLPVFEPMAGVYDLLQGENESTIDSADAMSRYAEFECERTRICAQHGWRTIIGSFSSGVPKNMKWWGRFLPAMVEGVKHGSALGVHAYTWPGLDDRWYLYRHEMIYGGCPEHDWIGFPEQHQLDMYLTEFGFDMGMKFPGRLGGFKDIMSPVEYMEWLKEQDPRLHSKKYLKGVCIYPIGNLDFKWTGYDAWPLPAIEIAQEATPTFRKRKKPKTSVVQTTVEPVGVDISWFQRGKVKFTQLKKGGVKFVISRASYGLKRDSTHQNFRNRANNNGLLFAPYHYLEGDEDPIEQARAFLGCSYPGNFPHVVDVEDWKLTEGMVRACLEFLSKRLSRRPWIYTRASYWDKALGDTPWASEYDLWVADAGKGRVEPRIPKAWKHRGYEMWQTGVGRMRGSAGPICIDRFNGTVEELMEKYGTIQ